MDVHYFAVLIGVGATSINAYLAQQAIADRHKKGLFNIKAGSQDSQKVYEHVPNLFGSFRDFVLSDLLLTQTCHFLGRKTL